MLKVARLAHVMWQVRPESICKDTGLQPACFLNPPWPLKQATLSSSEKDPEMLVTGEEVNSAMSHTQQAVIVVERSKHALNVMEHGTQRDVRW